MCPGDKIKQLRKERKMTQEELGKLLGVNKSAVQKYEKGDVVNLKLETIRKLCEIFEVNPVRFIFPEAEKFDFLIDTQKLSVEVKLLEQLELLYGENMTKILVNIVQLNGLGRQKINDFVADIVQIDRYRA